MARQARFVVPGQVHWVALEAQAGSPGFAQAQDQQSLREAVQLTVLELRLPLHALALHAQRAEFLLSPAGVAPLAAFVQGLGRRFVGPYNRRHGRRGALWSSRYRCAVLEPGDTVLLALCGMCLSAGPQPEPGLLDSAAHYLGQARVPWLSDPLAYWQLGNTPFAREARLRDMLQQPDLPARCQALAHAAASARVVGAPGFVRQLEMQTGRALVSRRPGRPRA